MIRFERAKGRCEQCRLPHGQIVIHLGDGRWWDAERAAWRDGQGRLLRPGADTPFPSTRSAPRASIWRRRISTMIQATTVRAT